MLPHASHARQVVLELRELHLELSFGADRMLREDVEDQLGAIDHTRLERVLERPLLGGLELVVDEQHLGAGLPVRALQLLELALAEVCAPLRAGSVLDQRPDRLDERGSRELPQLGQLVLGIDSLSQHGGDEPTLQRGVRLALDHDLIMPPTGQNPTVAPVQLSPTLAATGTYPFVKLEQAKRRLAAQGIDLIDFGKGDPREPTDSLIRQALADSISEISIFLLAQVVVERSSMTGYRSGFVAAQAELVAALKQFRPSVGTAPQEFVQRASIAAWDDEKHVERTRAAYRRKRDALLPTLTQKGVRIAGAAATMFLWL